MANKCVTRTVNARVACELCEECRLFYVEYEGVHLLSDGLRGLPIFDPHCKHIDVCTNLLNMINKRKEQTINERSVL